MTGVVIDLRGKRLARALAQPDLERAKRLQLRLEEIALALTEVSDVHLDQEYQLLFANALDALCEIDPQPLLVGKAAGWAAGIAHAIGRENFLFDAYGHPRMAAAGIGPAFGVSPATANNRSRDVRRMLGLDGPMGPRPELLREEMQTMGNLQRVVASGDEAAIASAMDAALDELLRDAGVAPAAPDEPDEFARMPALLLSLDQLVTVQQLRPDVVFDAEAPTRELLAAGRDLSQQLQDIDDSQLEQIRPKVAAWEARVEQMFDEAHRAMCAGVVVAALGQERAVNLGPAAVAFVELAIVAMHEFETEEGSDALADDAMLQYIRTLDAGYGWASRNLAHVPPVVSERALDLIFGALDDVFEADRCDCHRCAPGNVARRDLDIDDVPEPPPAATAAADALIELHVEWEASLPPGDLTAYGEAAVRLVGNDAEQRFWFDTGATYAMFERLLRERGAGAAVACGANALAWLEALEEDE